MDEWYPKYDSSHMNYNTPITCDTSLKQRWKAFFQILSNPIIKIIYNSQLVMLPILITVSQLDDDDVIINEMKPCNIFDPKIAAHLCDSDMSDSDLELNNLFFKYQIMKKLTHNNLKDAHSHHMMGGKVTIILSKLIEEMESLFSLHHALSNTLQATGSMKVFSELEMPTMLVLAEMELRGIGINYIVFEELSNQINAGLSYLTSEAHKLAGQEFNPSSADQVADILYVHLALPTPAHTTKEQKHPSTAEEDLLRIREKHAIVQVILDIRLLVKLKGSYIDNAKKLFYTAPVPYSSYADICRNVQNREKTSDVGIEDENSHLKSLVGEVREDEIEIKRVHACWNQSAVRSGRLSCCRPNLQNIPNSQRVTTLSLDINIREMFSAGNGNILLGADYSQIEMRVMAELSGDTQMKSLFHLVGNDGDIYKHLAGIMYGKSISSIDKVERERAKVVCLG